MSPVKFFCNPICSSSFCEGRYQSLRPFNTKSAAICTAPDVQPISPNLVFLPPCPKPISVAPVLPVVLHQLTTGSRYEVPVVSPAATEIPLPQPTGAASK